MMEEIELELYRPAQNLKRLKVRSEIVITPL